MTSPGHNSADPAGPSSSEEQLGELINEFFDRRQRGENLSKEAFLSEHPAEADELRRHLRGLDLIAALGSSTRERMLPGGATPRPVGSSAQDGLTASGKPPPDIPGYQILKQIGRGGMGVVFKAIQLSTKRVVALKLLLEGPLASEGARRRFEREVALAAQLRHPNIIPIYDSGVADGRMYYAMEHVFGLALSDYLKAHEIGLADQLRLFTKVCVAIGHAHQRGVIHRDLKPSNILVDGDGEPHVLDFGLAKAGALGDTTTSVTAAIIGTPAYMSPEQATGDPNAIDTRTDVYSLGVLLYEVLTGRMPYDTSGAMGKVLQNIAHAEPLPPSKHDVRVGSELSAIALKALEKHKENRYQSVDAFCSDVRRHLAGEPVSAKPASGAYLLRKVIWKHRLAVGLCSVLLCFVGAMSILVRYYSGKVEQSQQEVRQLQERVSADQNVQVAGDRGDRQDAEATPLQRDEAEAALAWWLKNVDPETARLLRPFIHEIGNAVARGEDPGTAILSLLTAAKEATAPDAEAAPPRLSKESAFDPTKPLFSPRPDLPREPQQQAMPTAAKIAEAVETFTRLAQGLKIVPPTTRPATSQPGTSLTATAAPPDERPDEGAPGEPPGP